MQLIEDIKDVALGYNNCLQFVKREPRVNGTWLWFSSSLADIDIDHMKTTVSQGFKEPLGFHLKIDGDKCYLIISVPRADKIHWRCFERFSCWQVHTVVSNVIVCISAVGLGAFAIYRM